jgi:hypothetical protein
MAAEPCIAEVWIGICQPSHERACTDVLKRDREQPDRHLFARRDNGVVLARVVQRRQFARPIDELVRFARHGGDHDGDLKAAVDLALNLEGDVPDTLEVRHRRASELHHESGHGGAALGP